MSDMQHRNPSGTNNSNGGGIRGSERKSEDGGRTTENSDEVSDVRNGVSSKQTSDHEVKANTGDSRRLNGPEWVAERIPWYDQSWREFAVNEAQQSNERCRASSRALFQLLGLIIPVYVGALVVVFAEKQQDINIGYILPLVFWLSAVVVDIISLLPWKWQADINIPKQVKVAFRKMATSRRKLIWTALALTISGVASLVGVLGRL